MRSPPFWFVFMVCAALPLGARDVGVTILDGELGMSLEGVEIRSYDGTSHQSDGEGRLVLTVPDDRPVVIRGNYPGYSSERLTIDLEHDEFVLELHLTGTLEARELVLEESRDREAEGVTGRSVALEEAEIQRTGELGIIEDVMTSIKLLPGVGYSGLFNAMPSIRGGQPGDLVAAMDGFYIENPYHWGGGFSIFDPRMVQSARLSHGVFSARYGHTISGLLDVSVKKPSPQDLEFELGLSTSMTNASLSFPLNGRGGVMIMGRLTYYDPVVWAAQAISRASDLQNLKAVESISTAPYIRSAALSSSYRFTDKLEMSLTGFFGADGVAADYENEGGGQRGLSNMELAGHWINYQAFGLAGLSYNPRNDMILSASLGAGFLRSEVEGHIAYSVQDVPFNGASYLDGSPLTGTFSYDISEGILSTDDRTNVQGRLDFDWDLGRGFLASLGLEELYSRLEGETDLPTRGELPSSAYSLLYSPATVYPTDYVNYPLTYHVENDELHSLAGSAYLLAEYGSPGRRFGAELGLRLDHVFFTGDGFFANSLPVLSPRLNLDINLLKNRGPLDSLALSLGTGLFSSTTDVLSTLREPDLSGDYSVKPNRSFTSVGGLRLEFSGGIDLDIEAYYKYVFDRTYVFSDSTFSGRNFRFDGQGRIWGIDLMLKRAEGRYIDGWIAYSFNHARYREPGLPEGSFSNISGAVSGDWYYPSFHRFHVLNLVFNVKPTERFTITTRLGFASGVPLAVVVQGKQAYSVTVLNEAGTNIIQKWKQFTRRDDSNRTSFSIPMDIKFSFFNYNPRGKARLEFYVAVENVFSLLHTPKGNTTFNPYTGEEDTGSMSASYDIPIPIPSFGFRWSY
ncbi:MAG: TonB-dependent receptor plug domain-containing protein [Treponema sp.]|jgi:hypothetical protein|nr:TonB-dependent receptor plug domain-containing protein [Treponema sp.]